MAAMDVIEWRDTSGKEIVRRWPEFGAGNIRLGSQLTVRESQEAIFFRDGKALDVFKAGRHTLTSANLPLLDRLINLPFGGKAPFQAEVYFVNMRTLTGLKWGTSSPVVFRDSELTMVQLRAFGGYTCRVVDSQLFVNEVVGTESFYTTMEVSDWLRDFIVSRFNDVLGEVLDTVLDLPKYYDEIGQAMRARVGEDFRNYGLELIDFLIEAITPPQAVLDMIDKRAGMGAVGDMGRFMQYQAAQAIGDMPSAEGGGGAAGAGMGLGAGAGMGAAIMQTIQQAMKQAATPGSGTDTTSADAEPAVAAPRPRCPNCESEVPEGAKFCPECGQPLRAPECPACNVEVPTDAKFCPECGQKLH
jgi:membrane protease subunit (stomatin/prohibitin family)